MYSTAFFLFVLSLHKMNMLVLWHYKDEGNGKGTGMLNRRERGSKGIHL